MIIDASQIIIRCDLMKIRNWLKYYAMKSLGTCNNLFLNIYRSIDKNIVRAINDVHRIMDIDKIGLNKICQLNSNRDSKMPSSI